VLVEGVVALLKLAHAIASAEFNLPLHIFDGSNLNRTSSSSVDVMFLLLLNSVHLFRFMFTFPK